jgi:hypothetical protein
VDDNNEIVTVDNYGVAFTTEIITEVSGIVNLTETLNQITEELNITRIISQFNDTNNLDKLKNKCLSFRDGELTAEYIEYPDHTVPKKTFKNGYVKGLVVDLSGVKEQQFKGPLAKENLSFVYNSSEKTCSGTGYIVLSSESGKKQGEGQSDTFDLVYQTGKLSIN